MREMVGPSHIFGFVVRIVLCILVAPIPLIMIDARHSQAQVPPITPSGGLGTQVSSPINLASGQTQYDITGGTRPGGGGNLFHSFGDFNVPNNNIANFLNDSGLPTSNILGRVTGGNISNIFGTIQTTGFGGANLFLMNPAGFLFGPNATVNVGGMVAFTSADYLRLGDGALFTAVPDAAADALLSTAPVAAYGFLGSNPGAITVQGSQFTVTEGTGIALVGGNINIESGTPDGGSAQPARLSAPNGTIQLASAASPGEFDAATLQPLPNVADASFTSFGAVTLTPDSNINVSGTNRVSIRSGEFVLSVNDAVLSTAEIEGAAETVSLSLGSSIISSNAGPDPGADIEIIASTVQMDGASAQTVNSGDGAGGNLSISADTVSLTNGAQIVSTTTGAGNGGNILVDAMDSLTISGSDTSGALIGVLNPFTFLVSSGLFSTTSGSGAGGSVTVNSGTVTLNDTGTLGTIASGDGRGGDLTLNVRNLNIENGGLMLSSAGFDTTTFEFAGNGAGGDITVSAEDSIHLEGFSFTSFLESAILTVGQNTGNGGNISLSAPNISLQNGGSLISFGFGTGNAGNIAIAADQLSVSGLSDIGNPSQISSQGVPGNSGTIAIAARTVEVSDNGQISTTGNEGDITIQAEQDVNVTSLGAIYSFGGDSRSGDVTIIADQVMISGHDDLGQSRIETLGNGLADVGSINLNVRNLVVTDVGRLSTTTTTGNAFGGIHIAGTHPGEPAESVTVSDGGKIVMIGDGGSPGGPIEINASTITLDQGIIQTEVMFGNAGSISLHADNLNLAGGFINTLASQIGPNRGGDVTINVTDTVSISGQFTGNAIDKPRPAGIYSDTSGSLPGGDISITAGNLISLSGPGVGVFSQTNGSSGHGGEITAQAPQVQLADGATISAKTIGSGDAGNILIKADMFSMNGGSTITASSTGSGAAGNVTIEGTASPAQSVLIDGTGSGIFTNTEGTGAGGTISINANSVIMRNGAAISSNSAGFADAGSIDLTANNGLSMQNSAITTLVTPNEGSTAGGGNIKITTSPEATVYLQDSLISASVADGAGGGGNVAIDPQFVILQNSKILAQAADGRGGAITITAGLFLPDATSVVNADSGSGLNGTVTIQSPNSPGSGKIIPLSDKPLIAAALLNQRCAALAGGELSSFTMAGRDSLPAEPGGWLSSPLAALSAGKGLEARGQGQEARGEGETPLLSLRQIAPPGFLTRSFALNQSAGCTS